MISKKILFLLLLLLINTKLSSQITFIDVINDICHKERKIEQDNLITLSDCKTNLLHVSRDFICDEDTFLLLRKTKDHNLFCSAKRNFQRDIIDEKSSATTMPFYQYLLIDKKLEKCYLAKYLYPLKEFDNNTYIGGDEENKEGLLYYIGELNLRYPYTEKLHIQIDFYSGDFTELTISKIENKESISKTINFEENKEFNYNIFTISYENLNKLYSKFWKLLEE